LAPLLIRYSQTGNDELSIARINGVAFVIDSAFIAPPASTIASTTSRIPLCAA